MMCSRQVAVKLLLCCLAFLLASTHAQDTEYKPVSTLNTTAYLGRWYQMYTSICFVALELGGDCTTADYTLRDDGKIALINQSRPPLVPRIFARTTGFVAQNPDPNTQGAFFVNQAYILELNPDDTEFREPGNYWIIALGPIVNGQYEWACVSDPGRFSFWVLARDPINFPGSQAEADALAAFEQFGFNVDNDFIETLQGEVCGDYAD